MTGKKRGPYRTRGPSTCILIGCEGRHYAKGLCRPHYRHQRRTGNTDDMRPLRRRWSEVEDRIILDLPEYPSGRARHRTVEEIAALIGRSSNGTAERRKRLKQGIIALV